MCSHMSSANNKSNYSELVGHDNDQTQLQLRFELLAVRELELPIRIGIQLQVEVLANRNISFKSNLYIR